MRKEHDDVKLLYHCGGNMWSVFCCIFELTNLGILVLKIGFLLTFFPTNSLCLTTKFPLYNKFSLFNQFPLFSFIHLF